MKSWKTSVTGILVIVTAIGNAALGYFKSGSIPDFTLLSTSILAGIGLISAKDGQVTGGTIQQ